MWNLKKAAALVLTAALGTSLLAGCGSTALNGSETLLTVNDDSVDLGVGSFYARYQQAEIYTYWGAYFGTQGLFDTVTDEEAGTTYGDSMKENVIEDLTKMLVISRHADEYDVALSDEQKSAISDAAQAFVDANTQEVLDQIGASKEDVEKLLTLQTIRSLMMDPLVSDVDTDIPDDEVQQSTVSYVEVEVPQEEESAEEADAEVDEDAEEAGETAEEESAPSADAVAAAEANAQAILDKLLASDDIAAADLDALAKEVKEDYSASSGSFTVSDPTDTILDAAVVEAAKDLKDGEAVQELVISDDGQSYFVVRMDKVFDEEATESERNSEIISRKEARFNEITDGWVEDAKDATTLNEAAWAKVTLTDTEPFSLIFPETETEDSTEEAAEEG